MMFSLCRWLEFKTDFTLVLSSKLVLPKTELTQFSSQICLPPRWNQFQLCKLLILVIRLTQDVDQVKIKRNGQRGVRVTFPARLLVQSRRYSHPQRYHLGYHGLYINNQLISQCRSQPPVTMDYQFFRATQQSLAFIMSSSRSSSSITPQENRWKALLLNVA